MAIEAVAQLTHARSGSHGEYEAVAPRGKLVGRVRGIPERMEGGSTADVASAAGRNMAEARDVVIPPAGGPDRRRHDG